MCVALRVRRRQQAVRESGQKAGRSSTAGSAARCRRGQELGEASGYLASGGWPGGGRSAVPEPLVPATVAEQPEAVAGIRDRRTVTGVAVNDVTCGAGLVVGQDL